MRVSVNPRNSEERVPPQNVELEMCVLGAVMLEPQAAYPLAKERLAKESFYLDGHGIIFDLMGELYSQGIPPDSIAVLDALRSHGLLERVGGSGVVMGMLNSVPTAASIEYHADLLAEKALGRSLIRGCTHVIDETYRQELPVNTVIELAENTIRHLSLHTGKAGCAWTVDELADEMLELFDNRCAQVEQLRGSGRNGEQLIAGLATGIPALDHMTGGLNKGELTIIAARPSMGKSALALNIADHIAQQHRIGFISLEMDRASLMRRLISAETHRIMGPYCVDTKSMENPGALNSQEIHAVRQATWNLKARHGDRLWIVDDCPAEFGAVGRTIRKLLRDGAQAIVLDYLQLIDSGSETRSRSDAINRNLEVAGYTKRLKGLAREYEVPIVVLSQLSRQNEKAGVKARPPQLSDLRESGAIEQDADVVLFIWPGAEGWNRSKDSADYSSFPEPLDGHLMLEKQRNGETGWLKIRFLKQASRFLPPAERRTV